MDETTLPTTDPTDRPARPTLQHRVLGWRGVAAVALASVILGGAGGAVLGAVSTGADGTTRGPGGVGGPGRFGGTGMTGGAGMTGGGTQPQGSADEQAPGGVQGGLPGRQGQRPPTGVPGQLPPVTAPQRDEEGGHNT